MIDEKPRYVISPEQFGLAFPYLIGSDRLNAPMHDGIIDTPRRASAFLAQLGVTTNDFELLDVVPERLKARCQRVTGIDLATIELADRARIAVWYWNFRGCSWLADRGEFHIITTRWTQNESSPDRFVRYRRWKTLQEILGDKNAV